MGHFFFRAEVSKARKQSEIDANYKEAAALAALVAPYRHARLSAVKLAGAPSNSIPFKDILVCKKESPETAIRRCIGCPAGRMFII
jgi:hypothetical protein